VFVLPTQTGPRRLGRPPAGAIDAAIQALTLLVDGRFAADVARYTSDVELIVLPAPNGGRVQPTDFGHAGRLIADALAAGRELLGRPSLVAQSRCRLREPSATKMGPRGEAPRLLAGAVVWRQQRVTTFRSRWQA